MNYNILLGDALSLFKDIEDETIDCIITDPPYEIISGGSNENAGVIDREEFYPRMMVKYLNITI